MLKAAPMPPAARSEPDDRAACRNCGQVLPSGISVCPGCGAAQGEANRCPHCSATAGVARHRTLGFSCLVCGGPRIALGLPGVALSPRTSAVLTNAGREQTKHIVFSAAGFLLSGMGGLALLIASVVALSATPGPLSTLLLFLAAFVPLAAGLLALFGARGARARRTEALRTAEVSALGDLQAVTGALSPARVAELMRVSPEHAELLLASASVESMFVAGSPARLRVEPPGSTLLSNEAPQVEAAAEPAWQRTRGDTEI